MPELANGKYVSQSDAIRQWWPAARAALIDTASEYGAWISHDELSDRIQASTGISTKQPVVQWIGRVLSAVAADAQQRGEPRLTSLSVTAERLVEDGYPGVPAGTDVRTRERVAAEDRLQCYRSFGATMPADGGTPTVLASIPTQQTRTAGTRPTRIRATATPPPPPAAVMRETTCPNCFMVVPVAATCRDCGAPLAV